jgi:hypothetical protein
MENGVVLSIFGFIALLIAINLLISIGKLFSNRKRYQEVYAIQDEVNKKVRPYLGSLEKKFEKDESSEETFGKYVFNLFKDKISSKNEKMVEKAICQCCSDYEGAECKEDFCLEGSGIECKK